MALYSSQLCPWTANGETACKEHFIDIDSGGAKLGESCAKEDCIQGTCFRAFDEKDGTCRHVLMAGDKGCKKSNHVCTNGLYCYDNVCRQKLPSSKYDIISDDKTKNNDFKTYMYILYVFIAVMILLLLIMIFMIISQSS